MDIGTRKPNDKSRRRPHQAALHECQRRDDAEWRTVNGESYTPAAGSICIV